MINRAWAPDYLARYFFTKQDQVWVTANGESFEVSAMDDGHLVNTLLMVERVSPDIKASIGVHVQETPLYAALKTELLERLEKRTFVVEPTPEAEPPGVVDEDEDEDIIDVDAGGLDAQKAAIALVESIIADASPASQGAVRLVYMDGDGEETIRVVYPTTVWESDNIEGRWYLRGFDTLRQEDRTFRFDRIIEAASA